MVGVLAPDDPSLSDLAEVVVLAVRRDHDGSAWIVDLALVGGPDDAAGAQGTITAGADNGATGAEG